MFQMEIKVDSISTDPFNVNHIRVIGRTPKGDLTADDAYQALTFHESMARGIRPGTILTVTVSTLHSHV